VTSDAGKDAYDVTLVVLSSGAKPEVRLTEEMLRVYREALADLGKKAEIIVVDDGVGGDFLAMAERLAAASPDARGVRFRRAFGESAGIATAVGMARGRLILTTTWYQQVGVDAVRRAVRLLDEEGYDYVAVRRTDRIDSTAAQIQSWAFNAYTRFLTKAEIHDLNCSFRAFRKEVVEELTFHGDLFRFISVFAIQKGFRVVEIEAPHVREEGPGTFLNPGLYLRRFLDILSLFFLIKFTKKPLRFFGLVGVMFLALGFAVCVWMVILKFVPQYDDRGRLVQVSLADKPMLVLGVFLVVLGIITASIGLIGEIIIFLQGREYRDYHVERVIAGGDGSAA
jgi:glycosyltransferase involved in cell wall biosynthesis